MKVVFIFFLLCSLKAHSICIRGAKANMRKGPGSNFKKSWVVGQFMPFLEVDRRGRWLKVKDVDGEMHWAHVALFSRSFSCAVVKTNTASLYKGPGPKHPRAEEWMVEKYTPFKKIDETSYWMKVESSNGKKYWIAKKHLWEPLSVQAISF